MEGELRRDWPGVGHRVRCRFCGGPHVLEQPFRDDETRPTAERRYVYVWCGEARARVYMGQVARAVRDQARE